MNDRKTDKVALITGGSRGVGLGTAIGLGELGYEVVIGVRDGRSAEEALGVLRARKVSASSVQLDVEQPADHQRVYEFLSSRFGKLDVLVNNAGIMLEGPRTELDLPNTTLEVSLRALERTFSVNFFAVVGLTQKLLPLIRRAPAGRIVNVSSILGSLHLQATSDDPRLPNHRQLAYNASKSALNAFTIHLARTLADTPIKVNAGHPGWVRTRMGGDDAELDIEQGAAISVALATLPDDGPTGVFRHQGGILPW